MQFVSLTFLLFLIITVGIYFIIPKNFRYIWLLIASWGFYYKLSHKLLILLVAVTFITYVFGRLLDNGESSEKKQKRPVLISGIVILLLVLGYFKYTGFLLETVKSLQSAMGLEPLGIAAKIALPVGISFYIFQAIGYLADCYMGKIPVEKNYLRLSLFISFFPQVMSGPIERAGNMLPQFKEPESFSYENMRDGLLLMMWGYFQKIIIADRLAVLVDHIYNSYENYNGTLLFLATIFYTLEIYTDFAGYSNIAIGSAKILGIDIMQNFEQPYLSRSIPEFWRRWHISLSSWLRDYLYIPLGGNRKGFARKLINICIVFAISGLWHGAAWTFVFWGLLHGLYQVFGILTKPLRQSITDNLGIDREGFALKLVNVVVTFMLVNIGWIFFRAPDFKVAWYVLSHMWTCKPWVLLDGTLFNLGLAAADVRLLALSILVLAIVSALNYKGVSIRKALTEQTLWIRWVVYIAAVLFIVTCGVWGPGYDAASFIYSSF